jgi:hypothetical protein
MAKAKKVSRIFDTMDVVSAACAAHRVNGQYIKVPYQLGDEVKRQTNRELVYQFLEDQSFITDADRLLAEDIKSHYQGKTFKILGGGFVTDYDRTTLKMLEEESCPEGYNVAVLASVPSSYLKSVARDKADQRVRFAQGGYVGSIGDKVQLDVEVIKSVFSQKYNVHFLTAITVKEEVVFFSYKQDVTVGTLLTIKGTVKNLRDGNVTQLNRVKVI